MRRDTDRAGRDAYEAAGTRYQEAALYIESFQAYVQLHQLRLDGEPVPVELRESRLDEATQELLQ